jgi:hypothetical protein
MYGREKICKIFVGKPMHRWEDIIKMALEGVDWNHLILNRDWWRILVTVVMNVWVQ